MGRKSASGGVAEHNGKIRLDIWYRGKRLRPVLDTEWNERNRRAALRMVGEIREKIRHGLFDPADYFPEYSGLETLTVPLALSTFRDYAQAWLRSLGQKATATREDYRRALDRVWLDELGERPILSLCPKWEPFSTAWPSGRTARSSATSRRPSSPAFGRPSRSRCAGRTSISSSARYASRGPWCAAGRRTAPRPTWCAMSS
mgnify:CR=1 FL=1